MIFLGDDVFRYEKFFTVIHIYSFQCEKYVFYKLKILWNFLFSLFKKLGFWIFLVENFTVCSSIIVLCVPSVRAFPIQFLALKQINVGSQSEFMKKIVKQVFTELRKKVNEKAINTFAKNYGCLLGLYTTTLSCI